MTSTDLFNALLDGKSPLKATLFVYKLFFGENSELPELTAGYYAKLGSKGQLGGIFWQEDEFG